MCLADEGSESEEGLSGSSPAASPMGKTPSSKVAAPLVDAAACRRVHLTLEMDSGIGVKTDKTALKPGSMEDARAVLTLGIGNLGRINAVGPHNGYYHACVDSVCGFCACCRPDSTTCVSSALHLAVFSEACGLLAAMAQSCPGYAQTITDLVAKRTG